MLLYQQWFLHLISAQTPFLKESDFFYIPRACQVGMFSWFWTLRLPSCIPVDVYMHFVGTCRIFTLILKMNILKGYITSIVSSVQMMKLVDSHKHSQGDTVCTFSSTYRMESCICYVTFWRNILSPSSFHPDGTRTAVQKSCVAINMTILLWPCSLEMPSSFAHHHMFKPNCMFFFFFA